MTQQQLADKGGLGRAVIAQIETGLIKEGRRETLLGLARGFDITVDELNRIISGGVPPRSETPDQLLEKLRLAQPIAVPVVKELNIHADRVSEPHDYVYLPRARGAGKNIEALIVHGDCLSPTIEENDVVIIDRDAAIDSGDIVACLFGGDLHLGKLKKIGNEPYLENGHGRIKLSECQVAAVIIQVIRRLK